MAHHPTPHGPLAGLLDFFPTVETTAFYRTFLQIRLRGSRLGRGGHGFGESIGETASGAAWVGPGQANPVGPLGGRPQDFWVIPSAFPPPGAANPSFSAPGRMRGGGIGSQSGIWTWTNLNPGVKREPTGWY